MNSLNILGIIPDGNRRWAKRNGLLPIEGHKKGAEVLDNCLDFFRKKGVKETIVYGLSEDNLNRPKEELKDLFKLYEQKVNKFLRDERIHKDQVKIEFLSTSPEMLPISLKDVIKELSDVTKNYTKYVIKILLAWSAQKEIAKVMAKAYELARKGLPLPDINKLLIVNSYPDLIIRTGEYVRLSDFLSIQAKYSEIYVINKLFPDCTIKDFERAYNWYSKQKKNFGK